MKIETGARRALASALAALGFLAVSGASLVAQGAKQGPPTNPGMAVPKGMPVPKTPKVPTTFEGLFAERSDRAVRALGYLRCLRNTMGAVEAGFMGRVPRAWLLVCVEQNDEWRGVFTESADDAGGLRVMGQFSMKDGRPTTASIDTNRVVSAARSLIRGISAPVPGSGKFEHIPLVLPQDGYNEVWFLPMPNNPSRVVVGGDSLIQMTADGVRELGHSRSTPAIRTFAIDRAAGSLLLESTEDRVPLLSELMVAHLALDGKERVVVRTKQYESTFSRGSRTPRHSPLK